MKRDPALQSLSSEHHGALHLALLLRRAADSGDPHAVAAGCADALRAFETDLLPHFAEEERALLPLLQSAGADALAARTLVEHRAMKRVARELEIADADALRRFADLLTAHVRFEERELFAEAQRILDPAALARIGRGRSSGGAG